MTELGPSAFSPGAGEVIPPTPFPPNQPRGWAQAAEAASRGGELHARTGVSGCTSRSRHFPPDPSEPFEVTLVTDLQLWRSLRGLQGPSPSFPAGKGGFKLLSPKHRLASSQRLPRLQRLTDGSAGASAAFRGTRGHKGRCRNQGLRLLTPRTLLFLPHRAALRGALTRSTMGGTSGRRFKARTRRRTPGVYPGPATTTWVTLGKEHRLGAPQFPHPKNGSYSGTASSGCLRRGQVRTRKGSGALGRGPPGPHRYDVPSALLRVRDPRSWRQPCSALYR